MITVAKIWQRIYKIFREYYPTILFMSIFICMVVGFFHFELSQNNRDLLFWKRLISFCYNDLENCALLIMVFFVVIKIAFVGSIILINRRSVVWFDELSQVEVKKRYADFLFLRLIAKIDRTESKYLRITNNNDFILLKNFILAHEDMRLTIENFRKDARKLLTPNEMEVSLPTEEVYGVQDDDERFVRRSRFYRMDISVDDDLIKSLVNP